MTNEPLSASAISPVDQLDLEPIKERLQAATPGPWTACRMTHAERGDDLSPSEIGEYATNSVLKGIREGVDCGYFLFISAEKPDGSADVCHVGNGPTSPSNAKFIEAARADVPALVAEIEQLRAALLRLQSSDRAQPEELAEALAALPDSLGRPLATRISILLDTLRRESHIGVELRRELDGGIERDAKAIEEQWPEAAKYLRSHAHIEDGV